MLVVKPTVMSGKRLWKKESFSFWQHPGIASDSSGHPLASPDLVRRVPDLPSFSCPWSPLMAWSRFSMQSQDGALDDRVSRSISQPQFIGPWKEHPERKLPEGRAQTSAENPKASKQTVVCKVGQQLSLPTNSVSKCADDDGCKQLENVDGILENFLEERFPTSV